MEGCGLVWLGRENTMVMWGVAWKSAERLGIVRSGTVRQGRDNFRNGLDLVRPGVVRLGMTGLGEAR